MNAWNTWGPTITITFWYVLILCNVIGAKWLSAYRNLLNKNLLNTMSKFQNKNTPHKWKKKKSYEGFRVNFMYRHLLLITKRTLLTRPNWKAVQILFGWPKSIEYYQYFHVWPQGSTYNTFRFRCIIEGELFASRVESITSFRFNFAFASTQKFRFIEQQTSGNRDVCFEYLLGSRIL